MSKIVVIVKSKEHEYEVGDVFYVDNDTLLMICALPGAELRRGLICLESGNYWNNNLFDTPLTLAEVQELAKPYSCVPVDLTFEVTNAV